ncbi:MAG: AIPR family protein [Hyphomicrobiaceae bacterium]
MPSLSSQYLDILKRELTENYVPYLPPLHAMNGQTADQQAQKQISRAFSAFILNKHVDVAAQDAAKAVVDDFDDNGIDAIWYERASETLYLLQSKLKPSEQFGQVEAHAFCAGVRLLLKQDFSTFNSNVQARQVEIENALAGCSHIQLVIGIAGSGVSDHANATIDQLISDEDLDEERLEQKIEIFDAEKIVCALLAQQAYKPVNAEIRLTHHGKLEEPRVTYYGVVKVEDLVALHQAHGKALYERNIRYFLGSRNSDVNRSIQETLTADPEGFLYLNNGVTALCNAIDPKGKLKGGAKVLKALGFSIINGAQTVASAAEVANQASPPDISKAKVLLTLIKADSQGPFGSRITKARNHQNPVATANFASLDPEQERLRQELAYYQIAYHYRPEALAKSDARNIQLPEAIAALSCLQPDPRFPVWLKASPAAMNDAESASYKLLFTNQFSGVSLANAVTYLRCMQVLLRAAEWSTTNSQERLTYRHGANAICWILMKRLRAKIFAGAVIGSAAAQQHISQGFDLLRQQGADLFKLLYMGRGPLAFFKSQSDTVPYLALLMETNFELNGHAALPALKAAFANEAFPRERLFSFMSQQAPQL